MFQKVKSFVNNVVDKVNGKMLACANAVVAAPLALTVAAGAEGEVTSTATVNGMVTAANDIFSVINVVINNIFTNPILLFFFSASAIMLGIKMFRKIKSAAKSN